MGSFESWVRVMGGILQTVGVPGFLDNRAEFKQRGDVDGAAWRGLISAWHEARGDSAVTGGELFPLALEWIADKIGDGGERSQKTRFGKLLNAQTDRIYNGFKITREGTATSGNFKGAALYRLKPAENRGTSAPNLLMFPGGSPVEMSRFATHQTPIGEHGEQGERFSPQCIGVSENYSESYSNIRIGVAGKQPPHVPHVPPPPLKMLSTDAAQKLARPLESAVSNVRSISGQSVFADRLRPNRSGRRATLQEERKRRNDLKRNPKYHQGQRRAERGGRLYRRVRRGRRRGVAPAIRH